MFGRARVSPLADHPVVAGAVQQIAAPARFVARDRKYRTFLDVDTAEFFALDSIAAAKRRQLGEPG